MVNTFKLESFFVDRIPIEFTVSDNLIVNLVFMLYLYIVNDFDFGAQLVVCPVRIY